MRLAVCNELFEHWPLADAFRFIAETGYQAVELAPFTLDGVLGEQSARRRTQIRRIADDCGLAVTGLHWLLAGTQGLHVSAVEPEVRRRTLAYLNELTVLCAELGGRVLVFGSPAQRSTPPGMPESEARGRAVDMFTDWAVSAERAGVTICLEALPADETDFMNTTADVVGIVRTIDSPAVQMVLDVKSMSSEPTPIAEQIELAAAYLAYFQANDANRRGPGFGATDFVPIFQTLTTVGYHGDVSVEAFDFTPDPATVARGSIDYLRRCARTAGITLPGQSADR